MTMQKQMEMSGLKVTTSSSPLQWNSTNQWSPLLRGARSFEACVTIIVSGSGENDIAGQTIAVIGGQMQRRPYTESVIVWDPSTNRWRNGPNLNYGRSDLVAVVCRDKVYAIGGLGSEHNYCYNTVLDTIESIEVSSLLETMETWTTTTRRRWTRLQCRLSSPRKAFAAVVVQNRYIVILGGHSGIGQDSSSVDIIDTAPPHNNNNNNSNGEPTIVGGPSMNLARSSFGAAVMDNRIFVVGGNVNVRLSTSVESLLFQQEPQDKDHSNSNSNVSWTFANSSWRMEPHLTLSSRGHCHAVAKVGSCLVVAGGYCINHGSWTYTLVEVLDVQRGIVWSLPNLTIPREYGCSMVTLSDCLVVLGGNSRCHSVESLALSVYPKHERCYKFVKFLIEIEFLGQPSTNLQFPMRLTGNGNQILDDDSCDIICEQQKKTGQPPKKKSPSLGFWRWWLRETKLSRRRPPKRNAIRCSRAVSSKTETT